MLINYPRLFIWLESQRLNVKNGSFQQFKPQKRFGKTWIPRGHFLSLERRLKYMLTIGPDVFKEN